MRRLSVRPPLAVGMTVALTVLAPASVAQATTFTVTTTSDGVDSAIGNGVCATAAGQCTLRAAIQEANFDAAADTVNLPAGTFDLTIEGDGELLGAAGDLNVRNDLTILGAGAAVTVVDGAWASNPDRIFDVNEVVEGAGGTDLTISGVTIQDGETTSYGGAIHSGSDGTIRLVGVAVRSNHAGGGGGAFNPYDSGGMEVVDSALIGNTADDDGGVIYHSSGGLVTMTNVTISGNAAGLHAGALFVDEDVDVSLNNVTITGNVADSDGNGTGDGGGLFHYMSSTVLRNTIVAGNTDFGGQAPDCSGTVTSQGHNLVGSPAGCFGITGPGDITGQDPLLGPLADNGGFTMTHALLKGSPAINAGDPAAPGSGGTACAATDQRGLPRNCDIGAYERVVCGKVAVNRIGTEGNDTLTGTDAADGLLGFGGRDTLSGLGGRDGLCGGPGKDRLKGGGGKDRLNGEQGKDRCAGGGGKDKARKCETEKGIP